MKIHLIAVNKDGGDSIDRVYFALNGRSYEFIKPMVENDGRQRIVLETEFSFTKHDVSRIVAMLRKTYERYYGVRLQDNELVFIYDMRGGDTMYTYEYPMIYREIAGRLPKDTASRLSGSLGVLTLIS